MTRKRTRTYARILTLATVALAALAGFTSPAGATTTAPPAGIFTFEVTPAGQTLIAVTPTISPATDEQRAAVYAEMVTAAEVAAKGCEVYQVDLAELAGGWEAMKVGELATPNTPGALSAIADIVGTGVCATVTAPPLVPVAEPTAPVVDAPAAPTAPVISQEVAATSISVVKAPAMLPATGSATSTLAWFGGFVVACGGLVIKLGRLVSA